MTERGIDTGFWSDPFVQDISQVAKTFYLYSFTNEHCNAAGLYQITPKTISDETAIPRDCLPDIFKQVAPKVVYYADQNLLWVKNFIKRQTKSPKFLQAAAKVLVTIPYPEAVEALLNYNATRYSISIPYQYYIDKISILTRVSDSGSASGSFSVSASEEKGVGKGEGVGGKATHGLERADGSAPPPPHADSPTERAIIDTWRSVSGYCLTAKEENDLLARLRTSFPDLDIVGESKKWAVRKIEQPLTPESRITSQIWNWMEKAHDIVTRGGNHRKGAGYRHEHTKGFTYRKCTSCDWKSQERTEEEICPMCGAETAVNYKAGKYGHMVQG